MWVMGDGEHRDMIATCRADDGTWLTVRWDWRDEHEMVGFRHDRYSDADALLEEWTEEFETHGSVIIAGPVELSVNTPYRSDEYCVTAWWNYDLRPAVMSLELSDPTDTSWDEECTLDLPTGTHAAWEALVIKCGPPAPYREKLSWGP